MFLVLRSSSLKAMKWVDIMDQKAPAYRLDCKSKYRFYVSVCFDLIDATLVNSYVVYTKMPYN